MLVLWPSHSSTPSNYNIRIGSNFFHAKYLLWEICDVTSTKPFLFKLVSDFLSPLNKGQKSQFLARFRYLGARNFQIVLQQEFGSECFKAFVNSSIVSTDNSFGQQTSLTHTESIVLLSSKELFIVLGNQYYSTCNR